jgi:acyl-CoA reductase-like NAD-dependent aldehyde dehydrogenase
MPQTAKPFLYPVSVLLFQLLLLHLEISVPDPANNEELGTVPDMGVTDTKRAIDAAATAFKTWSKTTATVCVLFEASDCHVERRLVKHRHDILKKFFDLMHQNVHDLGRIIASLFSMFRKPSLTHTARL